MNVGVVAIGRNEGDRLKLCLGSASKAAVIVYVDSGSTDGSAQWAHDHAANVVELDMRLPFTAARARNAGFQRLREIAPELPYVQFVDGDCELAEGWLDAAATFLDSHTNIAAVCGRLRERYPEQSTYNWMCDKEWDAPSGEVRGCAGNVMMRSEPLHAVGGYRDNVIAGEEGELCIRLRAAGWRIWRLNTEMALHDAAMKHFSQWWRRSMKSGYGLAQGAYLHGKTAERYYVWESRRAWIWGVWLPLGCITAVLLFPPWGWVTWFIYFLQLLRQMLRNAGSLQERSTLALFQVLARFPEAWGQIKFLCDRLFERQPRLIQPK